MTESAKEALSDQRSAVSGQLEEKTDEALSDQLEEEEQRRRREFPSFWLKADR